MDGIHKSSIYYDSLQYGVSNTDERPEYHRVRVTSSNGQLSATSTGKQISSRLNSLAGANGLAIVHKTVKPKSNNEFYFPSANSSSNSNVIIFDDL